MNSIDFKAWLKHHFAAFTGCAGWLAKFPVRPRHEGDPTQVDVLGAWERILGDVSPADAKRATDLLASGDEQFAEKMGYDHHPRDVRRIARRLASEGRDGGNRRQWVYGERTYACRECFDSGVLPIVHPRSIEAAAARKLWHPIHNPEGIESIYRCVAACTCVEGQRWVDTSRRSHKGEPERSPMLTMSPNVLRITWFADEDWWPIVNEFAGGHYAAPTPQTGREFNPNEWAGVQKQLATYGAIPGSPVEREPGSDDE